MQIGHVNFEERPCANGYHLLGVAILDNSSSLNALTFDMLHQLNEKLVEWNNSDRIACVWLEGAGGKAFCAGGDVRAMYQVMSEQPKNQIEQFCTRYFTLEYQLDYLIHTFSKPVIAWGDGIVMGGGMGLYMASSHKIVTSQSRLAMPEVSIGLYPDVGATWFLNRIDPSVGLFLGLTGAQINGCDALEVGLANHFLSGNLRETVLDQLQISDWQDVSNRDFIVTELLEDLSSLNSEPEPEGYLVHYLNPIRTAYDKGDLSETVKSILSMPASERDGQTGKPFDSENRWLESVKRNLREGSAVTAHICYRQLKQLTELSLAECFRLELGLSVRCATLGEFQEGVRARLIDKDGEPTWLYSSVAEVDKRVIDGLFEPIWDTKQHPLSGLGRDSEQIDRQGDNDRGKKG